MGGGGGGETEGAGAGRGGGTAVVVSAVVAMAAAVAGVASADTVSLPRRLRGRLFGAGGVVGGSGAGGSGGPSTCDDSSDLCGLDGGVVTSAAASVAGAATFFFLCDFFDERAALAVSPSGRAAIRAFCARRVRDETCDVDASSSAVAGCDVVGGRNGFVCVEEAEEGMARASPPSAEAAALTVGGCFDASLRRAAAACVRRVRAARVCVGIDGRCAADTSSAAVSERTADREADFSSDDDDRSFWFAVRPPVLRLPPHTVPIVRLLSEWVRVFVCGSCCRYVSSTYESAARSSVKCSPLPP